MNDDEGRVVEVWWIRLGAAILVCSAILTVCGLWAAVSAVLEP